MVREEWIKQATELIMDINPTEIKSHDTDESLKEWCLSWQTAMNMLIAQASLEPKRWIPVAEQLPEEKGQFLVTYYPCYWNIVREDVYVGLDSFRGKTTWAKNANQKVIAWQPLPEPYKTQESEKN